MTNLISRLGILGGLALALGACSTPFRFVVPVLRFQSPEVNGPKENWNFAGGLQSYNDVELTSAVETIPIHSTPAAFRQRFMDKESDTIFEVLFSYSYLYLNLGYRPPIIPIEFYVTFPSTIGAKVQLLGDNADDAKSGNFSLALTAAWASRGISAGSVSETDTPEPAYYQYEFDRKIYDVAAIVGLRISDSILFYGGPFFFNSPYSMIQNLSTDTGDLASIKGTTNSYGANFGIQLGGGQTSLKLEVSVNKLVAYQAEDVFYHGGLAIGRRF